MNDSIQIITKIEEIINDTIKSTRIIEFSEITNYAKLKRRKIIRENNTKKIISLFNSFDKNWKKRILFLKEDARKHIGSGFQKKIHEYNTDLKKNRISRFFRLKIKPTLDLYFDILEAIEEIKKNPSN